MTGISSEVTLVDPSDPKSSVILTRDQLAAIVAYVDEWRTWGEQVERLCGE